MKNKKILICGINQIWNIAENSGFSEEHLYLAIEGKQQNLTPRESIRKIWSPIPNYYLAYDPKEHNLQKLESAVQAFEGLNEDRQALLHITVKYMTLKGVSAEIFNLLTSERQEMAHPDSFSGQLAGGA